MFEKREWSDSWNALGQNYCKYCHTFFPIGAQFGHGKHAVVDRLSQSTYVICDQCYIRIVVEGTQQQERTINKREEDKVQKFGQEITQPEKRQRPSKRELDYSASVNAIKKNGVKLWASSSKYSDDQWN